MVKTESDRIRAVCVFKEAASYVIRCDPPKRVELYVLCENWRAAGRNCKERGNKKGLKYVLSSFARQVADDLQNTEEAMSKLIDHTRTGRSDHFDEMRLARHWARCVFFFPLLTSEACYLCFYDHVAVHNILFSSLSP